MNTLSRHHVLSTDLGLASAGALSTYGAKNTPAATSTTSNPSLTIPSQTPLIAAPGTKTVNHILTSRLVTLDLDGVTARVQVYDETLDTPVLRVRAGDLLQVRVEDKLPTSAPVHWHDIALRQPSDDVPGAAQRPIKAGSNFTYQFVTPDPGTYFFHPHAGVQIDRGLYQPLVIDNPAEPGRYNHEWIITFDDWVDSVGISSDDTLAAFKAQNGTASSGMNHDMGGMDHGMSPLSDAEDITYPHYLVNGRAPVAPRTLTTKPGQKV